METLSLDRCAGDRDDAEAIASYAARSDATYVVCDGGKALFEADGKLERLSRADAERFGDVATATFLGTLKLDPVVLERESVRVRRMLPLGTLNLEENRCRNRLLLRRHARAQQP